MPTTLRVEVLFSLDSSIWLSRNCLGKSIRFGHQCRDIEIKLPPFEAGSPILWGNVDFDGYSGSARGVTGDSSPRELTVSKFKVIIRETVEGISQADLEGPDKTEVPERISAHQQNCKKIAERVALDFTDRLRLRGQTWLGPMGRLSYEVQPMATSFEELTDYRFKYGHGGTLVVPKGPGAATLDAASFDGLRISISGAMALPLPESFVADASYFSSCGAPQDLQRAILLAAIGCELKIKEKLKGKRYPKVSAAGHFDGPMMSTFGRSLKSEDPALYQDIKDLFTKRNKVAHSGIGLLSKDASKGVESSRAAFLWLDGI